MCSAGLLRRRDAAWCAARWGLGLVRCGSPPDDAWCVPQPPCAAPLPLDWCICDTNCFIYSDGSSHTSAKQRIGQRLELGLMVCWLVRDKELLFCVVCWPRYCASIVLWHDVLCCGAQASHQGTKTCVNTVSAQDGIHSKYKELWVCTRPDYGCLGVYVAAGV